MNDNTLKTIFKVVGVVYLVFGFITLCAAVMVLFGSATVGFAGNLAGQAGRTLGDDYPMVLAIIGSLLTFLMSAAYFAAGYGLLSLKNWADKAVGLLGILGIASGIYSAATGSMIGGAGSIFWGLVYLGLAYVITRKKDLFTN